MTVTITELPNEPIIMVDGVEPYYPVEDTQMMNEGAHRLYDRVQGPIYAVLDTSFEANFSQLMLAMATATRGDKRMNLLPLTIYATGDVDNFATKIVMEAIAKGMYGGITVKFVKTKDEALAIIRALVKPS
jgi:hypothetical protein